VSGAGATAVFAGPSIAPEEVVAALPGALVAPPIVRGELERLHRAGIGSFLILDGVFAHALAVAPSEIVDAIAAGARVAGAASIGAIRAAECWPAGMAGAGAIHRCYRLGILRDDDEVAVATDPAHGFAAVSTALVDVRFAVLAGLRRGLLDRARAASLLSAARGLHFERRSWRAIFAAAGIAASGELRCLCETTDVKRRDAAAAVALLAAGGGAWPWRQEPGAGGPRAAGPTRPARRRGAGRERYRGHDPLLGHELGTLQAELASWLRATGRLARQLPDGDHPASQPGWEATVWAELERRGLLERELMHWHAARCGLSN
jgi:hypothetical protein